jgi:hypothetical protein
MILEASRPIEVQREGEVPEAKTIFEGQELARYFVRISAL